MMLRNIVDKSKKNPIVGLVSDWNYTHVFFQNGDTTISGYTKKDVKSRIDNANLTEVRRGVEIDKSIASVKGNKVRLFDKSYQISRRKLSNWLVMFLFSIQILMAQNVAPVAVNDDIKICIDTFNPISVVNNDYDNNGDRIVLKSFTQPSEGYLVALGNSGKFDYYFGASDTISFTYKVKDLRFGNIGSLESNTANVTFERLASYNYTGTYSGTANRRTCRSQNTGAVTITGTAREVNNTYTSITLDANVGTVLLAPSAGGLIELIAN